MQPTTDDRLDRCEHPRRTDRPERSGPHRRVKGVRVAFILLFVASIPIVGLGWTTWRDVDEVHHVAASAADIEQHADRAATYTRLDAAVFEEMVWRAIATLATSLEAPPDVVAEFIGADPAAELARTTETTDLLVAEADATRVAASLERIRATTLDMSGVLTAHREISGIVASELDLLLELLTSTPQGSADTRRLVAEVDTLRLAVAARGAIAESFYGYFAAVFDLRDAPSVERARLIELRGRYDDSLARLRSMSAERPTLASALDAVEADPHVQSFLGAVDDLVGASFATGVPATSPDITLESVLANYDGFEAVYRSAEGASNAMLGLVDATTVLTLEAVADVRTAADDDIGRSTLTAAVLIAATLLSALLAAAFIVRPLRSLQRAARDLEQNQELRRRRLRGPAEVKAATLALHDASTHIDLVTRQARALAVGDLDAPVLDEAAPGGLGIALQDAVGTLRSALTQQDEFRRRLAHEAAHDGLTKLPNRNASMAQLTRSLARTTRSGSNLAVLFVDLDRFKDVNDHHGHQAGDLLLQAVAQRLVNHVREGDHVGRLGGDEFVVIAEPVADIDEAVGLAQRILATLEEPIDLGHVRVTVGASVGIAMADASALTADEMLRDADLAVYRAKSLGRGGIEICNEELRNEVAESADLTIAIRHAISHDELLLHYQPIVDTRTERLHALEALVRWQRPGESGLVPPDRFIGFAERSALIIDIDRWVLEAVARQIAEWHTGDRYLDTPVAINVSGRHLAHDRFVEHVLEPLRRHDVDPRQVIIEVTESALLDDLAAAAVKLQRLRDAGVRVSIDDFGTGYTSLAHLRSLPVDILKIDRSFTANAATNPHEASIVKLIIDTGHLLGATITAEGVETAIEADKLAGLGSDNLQGFFFARPQPPELLDGATLGVRVVRAVGEVRDLHDLDG
jgi:diguanylate cyclase (GGDEF)-like protein